MESATPTLWARLVAAVTVGVGIAASTGALSSKVTTFIAIGAALVQAFQHPVQGTDASKIAESPAVKTEVEIQKLAQ